MSKKISNFSKFFEMFAEIIVPECCGKTSAVPNIVYANLWICLVILPNSRFFMVCWCCLFLFCFSLKKLSFLYFIDEICKVKSIWHYFEYWWGSRVARIDKLNRDLHRFQQHQDSQSQYHQEYHYQGQMDRNSYHLYTFRSKFDK